jgi:Short C-terminal domain
MFARRRPLLRAAVVGGGAYAIGKRSGQRGAQGSTAEQGQDTSNSNAEQAPQAPGGAGGASVSDQLAQLSQLHQQGSLSDSEFAAAKSRLLGS